MKLGVGWVVVVVVLLLPSTGKRSQLLLNQTEVELGLQVGVEFDKNLSTIIRKYVQSHCQLHVLPVARIASCTCL